ncbi:MAG: hypothetical protein QOI13_423 [Paraburkholderia sp.]|nr:hypothetical protein [Paraburkholderia sp.]
MTYTKYFGGDVAGLVFVDASHPGQVQRLRAVMPQSDSVIAKLGATLAWSGVVRAVAPGLVPQAPHQSVRDVATVLAYAPTSLGPMLNENDALGETLAEAGTLRQLGNQPIFVLTAMAPFSKAALHKPEPLAFRASFTMSPHRMTYAAVGL